MIEVIRTILGRRYCGWCNHKDTSWFERLMGGDKFENDSVNKAQSSYWTFMFWWDAHVPIYKIGSRWHFKHHEEDYDEQWGI